MGIIRHTDLPFVILEPTQTSWPLTCNQAKGRHKVAITTEGKLISRSCLDVTADTVLIAEPAHLCRSVMIEGVEALVRTRAFVVVNTPEHNAVYE